MATFTLRAVVREENGAIGVIVETSILRARDLGTAKIEADRGSRIAGGIMPNALEILDGSGAVVARRNYIGKNVHAPWTY
jgi:hypothetical protein